MLIEFVGCPCSGKTTTAARVFASLKDEGVNAEFISEHARSYIARIRYSHGILPEEPVKLDDDDQVNIMLAQSDAEEIMSYACHHDGVIVSDSSPLNALLYMHEGLRQRTPVVEMVEAWQGTVDLLFFSHPVARSGDRDANRIHTLEQSLKIHEEIPALLAKYAPDVTPIPLYGDSDHRLALALREIAERRGIAIR